MFSNFSDTCKEDFMQDYCHRYSCQDYCNKGKRLDSTPNTKKSGDLQPRNMCGGGVGVEGLDGKLFEESDEKRQMGAWFAYQRQPHRQAVCYL